MRFHHSIKVHSTAIVHPNVVLGKNVTIEAYAVLGSSAEHKDFWNKPRMPVVIGAGTVIREFVTVNSGIEEATVVGEECILLRGSHVGHDAKVGDYVTLACNSVVGGHSYVMDRCNVGLGAVIKQKLVVGSGCMIGMNAAVTKHLEPWKTYVGVPAIELGDNKRALEKFKVSPEQIKRDMKVWKKLCELF